VPEKVHGGRPGASDAVFVTGAHRSGTTVLGEILSRAVGTWTVWEPFNQHWGLSAVDGPYRHVRRGARDQALDDLERYLQGGFGRWAVKRQGPRARQYVSQVRRSLRRRREWSAAAGKLPIVKDPFILLAIEAIQPRLTTRPVVVAIRHPCAWILSLRRMRWPAGPELNALIRQRELYENYLADVLPERDWTKTDELEAGARAWACLYRMVLVQSQSSEVAVVPMETFGEMPEHVIEWLFATARLPVPEPVEELADEFARGSGVVVPEQGKKHELRRDAKALSMAWHSLLSEAEVRAVRRITESVFFAFYSDWEHARADVAVRGTLSA
jgi:hypothetical protein